MVQDEGELIHISFLDSHNDMYVFTVYRIIFFISTKCIGCFKNDIFHPKWCAISIIMIILLIYIKNVIWFTYGMILF
jgi:hypothetical protein